MAIITNGLQCINSTVQYQQWQHTVLYTCDDSALTADLSCGTSPSPFVVRPDKDFCNDFWSSVSESTRDGMSFTVTWTINTVQCAQHTYDSRFPIKTRPTKPVTSNSYSTTQILKPNHNPITNPQQLTLTLYQSLALSQTLIPNTITNPNS